MKRDFLSICGIVLLLAIWWGYRQAGWLTQTLPEHLRLRVDRSISFTPLYVDYAPVRFDDPEVVGRAAAAAAFLGVTVLLLRSVLRRASPMVLIATACCGMAVSGASVAAIRGEDALTRPFDRPRLEYFYDVSLVGDSPRQFVQEYATLGRRLTLHAGTHPPGGVLFLWAAAKLIDPSIRTAAWSAIVFGALLPIPAYWLARQVMSRRKAGRCLAVMAVTPSILVFHATSMDAVFLVTTTFALAAGVAAVRRPGVWSILLAGACLWVATFFTFAAVIVSVFLIFWSVLRPRPFAAIRATAGVGLAFIACQVFAQVVVGYDLLAVADAAMHRDYHGVEMGGFESLQVWLGLAAGNVVAFLVGSGIATGGAVIGALLWTGGRPRAMRRWVYATVGTILVLALSTLFTLETERVWLPAAVLLGAAMVGARRDSCWILLLLAAQALSTELFLRTWW